MTHLVNPCILGRVVARRTVCPSVGRIAGAAANGVISPQAVHAMRVPRSRQRTACAVGGHSTSRTPIFAGAEPLRMHAHVWSPRMTPKRLMVAVSLLALLSGGAFAQQDD